MTDIKLADLNQEKREIILDDDFFLYQKVWFKFSKITKTPKMNPKFVCELLLRSYQECKFSEFLVDILETI